MMVAAVDLVANVKWSCSGRRRRRRRDHDNPHQYPSADCRTRTGGSVGRSLPVGGLISQNPAFRNRGFVVRRRAPDLFARVRGVWVRPGDGLSSGEIQASHLLLLAAAVTVATFLVRLVLPFTDNKYVDLNMWGWPRMRGTVRAGHHDISDGTAIGCAGPTAPAEPDCDNGGRRCGRCLRRLRSRPAPGRRPAMGRLALAPVCLHRR
jgi:hypothetical protein